MAHIGKPTNNELEEKKDQKKVKVIKAIFAALEVISIVVAAYALSVPSLDYVFPAGLGAICLFLGLEGLVTGEVATRINLISKPKNKAFFYLMISIWFIFSALLFQHSLSLWAKH
jgi:uncharacterized membrane protein